MYVYFIFGLNKMFCSFYAINSLVTFIPNLIILVIFILFNFFKILFIFRERGRVGQKEGKKH